MKKGNNSSLRIIELQAENVKRLKAVRIRPDKTLVRIEGRNTQGKSSVLDAIAAALGGGKWQPDEPVRRGEKRASVVLDLGELKVERRWTAKGGTILEVTANGARQSSPQAILDKLTNNLTFDPLAFVRMKAKEQAEVLRQLAGLDFSQLDSDRERLYQERTIANREAKSVKLRVGAMPPKPKNTTPIDIRVLLDKQQAALAHNRIIDELEGAVHRAEEAQRAAETRLKEAETELRQATATLNANRDKLAGKQRQDVDKIREKIVTTEQHNEKIRLRAEWEARSTEAKKSQAVAERLDDKIKEIDAEYDRRLRSAKFPLDGLGLDVDGPTLNGIPFSQASSSEQLRTGVAIGLAGKPKARIILIRDGSLLDGPNLVNLNKIAQEFDAQVFVERVAESASPSAVYIEDGEVMEEVP